MNHLIAPGSTKPASPIALSAVILALVTALGLLLPASASAREPRVAAAADSATSDWLYRGSDIPRDPAWHFGTLPNGVRYAVRNNGVPPGQVSIRVRMDVGSLFEKENERGYAHLLEHLSFRSSVHIPDGEAKRIWQRFGVSFGSDSNAQTTPTQTVYQLDLPSVTAASLDDSMKLLAGMIKEPRITPQAVTAERAVVLAELRESSGPQKRIADATNAHFFAGQLLGDRSPIGTSASLASADATSVGAFHRRWYRPERALIVVVGDGDPQEFAQLIAKHYGGWRGEGAPAPTPDFGAPVPDAPVAKLVVEPGQPATLALAKIRPWKKRVDTIANTQRLYLEYLAQALINRRLENRARTGGSYLVASITQEYLSRSADITLAQIVPLGDWREALADVRGVIADAIETPPSQADIDREANEIEAFLRKELENARNEPGARLADDLVRAVDINEVVTSPQGQVDLFRDIRLAATPEKMLEVSRAIFNAPVTRAILTTPEPLPGGEAMLRAALNAPIEIRNERLAAADVDFSQLPSPGPAGKVVEASIIAGLGAERLEFANGVTALVSDNRVEPGKVRVNLRFGSGRRSVAADAPNLLWTGDYALIASGLGPWGQNEIDQITNGRQLQLVFAIDDDAFELSAESSTADVADQLRLMAAKLSHPRWDAAPVERLRIGFLTGYDLNDATPNAVLERHLQGWLTGGDRRWAPPERAEMEALTPDSFRKFWEPRLASGPVEVQIFGDLQSVDYRKILAETLGALPPRPALAPPSGHNVAFATPNSQPMIAYHRGDGGQAAALTAWPAGAGVDDPRDARAMEVLAAIFNDRLFDRLRAEQGASYGPVVESHWPTAFGSNGGYLLVGSLLAPGDIGRFYEIADAIAADLVARPVSADELARNLTPIREQVARAATGNVYWMFLLEGATRDPRIIANALSIQTDMAAIDATDIQRLARQYLRDDRRWSLALLPHGMTLAEAATLDEGEGGHTSQASRGVTGGAGASSGTR
ncbi:M16 family metallopeptidase [Sphingopyxis sp. MWB1]|uniref:M16 family metallopeptidase n=1 Tax=Sphingopyxis sp. MWB1 TaxID=1537715 RepID=UPI0009DE468B|nr:M16 family metallopeptidase [Sphingopyxis sp. MWB1]